MTDFLALARALGPAVGSYSVERVAEALSVYAGGRSAELTAGDRLADPEDRAMGRALGIKRTRAQTLARQRDLANARHRGATGR